MFFYRGPRVWRYIASSSATLAIGLFLSFLTTNPPERGMRGVYLIACMGSVMVFLFNLLGSFFRKEGWSRSCIQRRPSDRLWGKEAQYVPDEALHQVRELGNRQAIYRCMIHCDTIRPSRYIVQAIEVADAYLDEIVAELLNNHQLDAIRVAELEKTHRDIDEALWGALPLREDFIS